MGTLICVPNAIASTWLSRDKGPQCTGDVYMCLASLAPALPITRVFTSSLNVEADMEAMSAIPMCACIHVCRIKYMKLAYQHLVRLIT